MGTCMTVLQLLTGLGLTIVGMPVTLLLVFLATFLLQRKLSEVSISRLVQIAVNISLASAVLCAVLMLWQGIAQHPIELGDWVITPYYHLKFEFVLDVRNHLPRDRSIAGHKVTTYEIPYDGRQIWGATASMLISFARMLREVKA